MQEFFVASTSRLGADVLIVKDILHSFERFETIIITSQIIKEAIDLLWSTPEHIEMALRQAQSQKKMNRLTYKI